ncbi:Uncharacterised protein [Vibrio cholerae]|nr:Uncharacterised protein [Vibrio cholerae]
MRGKAPDGRICAPVPPNPHTGIRPCFSCFRCNH